jgi:hypothetical protein
MTVHAASESGKLRALLSFGAETPPLSLPGLIGQSNNHTPSRYRHIGEYWMPAFAGMTGDV